MCTVVIVLGRIVVSPILSVLCEYQRGAHWVASWQLSGGVFVWPVDPEAVYRMTTRSVSGVQEMTVILVYFVYPTGWVHGSLNMLLFLPQRQRGVLGKPVVAILCFLYQGG